MKGNMLIAHGGGPTPVINSSLSGALAEAEKHSRIGRVYGARFGAEGILSGDLIDLTDIGGAEREALLHTPASALGSCRRKLTDADYPVVLDAFRRHDIRWFFYNGGNDSMDTCHKIHLLAEREGYELHVIGIPKTIDNDLVRTDTCPGFGSAARYAAMSALELSFDASALPIHVVVMEVMGRDAGWLTAASALYREQMPCELLTYLPESPFQLDAFLADVQAAYAKGRGLLVTVSEGVRYPDGVPVADTGVLDGFGHRIAGGAGQRLADLIIEHTPLKARAEKPGLLGRVSMTHVTELDRRQAAEVGAFAVRSAAQGATGGMVSIQAERRDGGYTYELALTPLAEVANAVRKFPVEWLNRQKNGVEPQFADYCLPLVGQPGTTYCNLRDEKMGEQ